MMAQTFAAPGMGPARPGMPHGHPMLGVPHPTAHMAGQPGPGMMQGMHPGVSGPQVTQGPMVTGMPHGAGTQAPMQQNMAMAHLGQQHMFQQPNPNMSLGQMQQQQQNAANQQMMRQRMVMAQQHAQAQAQGQIPMGMVNNPQFHQQMAQMKMSGMPGIQPQQLQQMQQNHFQQQQQQQQHRLMMQQQQQQAQAQQAQAAQQAAMRAAAQNQQAMVAQQMQISRSQQEQTTQPPPAQSTPAPQNQPPPPQPTPTSQPQQPPVQQTPKPQQTPQQSQQQGTPQPQVKQDGPEDDTPIKQQQETANPMMMQDIKPPQPQENFTGQCILQLLLYQDQLANPDRPNDLAYWEETIQKYFSPFGSIRQQLYNNKQGNDKSFQLQYASLARFYYSHFTSGIKQILMHSFDHNQSKLPNGGIHIWSNRASLTYVFHNDVRVTTQGSLKVSFDEMQKIEHLFIATSGWTEYVPRHALQHTFPEDTTPSPKLNKNAKKNQQKPGASSSTVPSTLIPPSVVCDFGLPPHIVQFLEVAEVMTAMGPLMECFHSHPGITPRDALTRINYDHQQNHANLMRMQQQNANGVMANNQQMAFQQQRAMGMMPNQLQSPALQHLGLPHGQASPHMGGPNHAPSPAQNPGQGGVSMMHQMSAQGSNLSGSQGPSTNTSPNVSNKRRRASQIKMEDDNNNQQDANVNGNKVKPSPRMGKRQKGQS